MLATVIQNIPPSQPNVNRHKTIKLNEKDFKINNKVLKFIDRNEQYQLKKLES